MIASGLGVQPGDGNVYMDPLFQGAVNGIAALKTLPERGTGTDTDDDAGFGYLSDGTDDPVTSLTGDRTGHHDDVG